MECLGLFSEDVYLVAQCIKRTIFFTVKNICINVSFSFFSL